MATIKGRDWVFTANNYSDAQVEWIIDRVGPPISKYLCFQPEVAPGTATRHLQGYVSFENARGMLAVSRLFGDIHPHLEKRRGTPEECIAYCSKEESRDTGASFGFREWGDRPSGPGQGSRSDLTQIGERIRQGQTLIQIATDHPGDFIRYSTGLLRFQSLFAPVRVEKSRVFWFYGTTGTGKSYAARTRFPDAYWKAPDNLWWDGYNGVSDVVIDDYRCNFAPFSYMLRLLDAYPMQVQVKGASVQFASKNIIITAPQHPRKMWLSRTNEQLEQLLRRIEVIELFGEEPEERNLVQGFNPN
jgi:hypothetical protein